MPQLDRNLAIGWASAVALAALFLAWLSGLPVMAPWVAPPREPATARAVSLPVVLPAKRVVPPAEPPPVEPLPAQLQPAQPPKPPQETLVRVKRAPAPTRSAEPEAAAAPAADKSGNVEVERGANPDAGSGSGPGSGPGSGSGSGPGSGSDSGSGPGSGPGTGAGVVYGAGQVDELPVPVAQPWPQYPDWARRSGQTAVLVLRYVVGADGRVRDLQIRTVRGDPRLSEPVRQTVPQWRFKPALRAGRPVAVRVEQEWQFDLEDE